eukprot:516282-Hanusia_phi.AAC.2
MLLQAPCRAPGSPFSLSRSGTVRYSRTVAARLRSGPGHALPAAALRLRRMNLNRRWSLQPH